MLIFREAGIDNDNVLKYRNIRLKIIANVACESLPGGGGGLRFFPESFVKQPSGNIDLIRFVKRLFLLPE